jgi:hypothetical protein
MVMSEKYGLIKKIVTTKKQAVLILRKGGRNIMGESKMRA